MTALFYLPFPWFAEETINLTAAVIFAVAALTDWFDGFLARLWKQTSDFGALPRSRRRQADGCRIATFTGQTRPDLCFVCHDHYRQGNYHFRIARMDGANGQKEQRCRRHRR